MMVLPPTLPPTATGRLPAATTLTRAAPRARPPRLAGRATGRRAAGCARGPQSPSQSEGRRLSLGQKRKEPAARIGSTLLNLPIMRFTSESHPECSCIVALPLNKLYHPGTPSSQGRRRFAHASD